MRILIYGAGVIGSLYAAMIAGAGLDVTVYARGKRLISLQEKAYPFGDHVSDPIRTGRGIVIFCFRK